MSLRNRVALAGGAVVLAALVLASVVLYPSLGAELSEQSDATLVTAVDDTPDLIRKMKEKSEATGTPISFFGKPIDVGSTRLQFLQPPVRSGPSAGFIDITAADEQVYDGTRGPYFRTAEYGGVRYRVYTAPLPGDRNGTLVRASMPVSVVGSPLDRMGTLLVAITAGGSVLAALVARLAAGRVLRPVRRLTETVEHITATQDLSARIDAGGRDEIARLARAFASMTAAVDASVTTQRRLVADASHELRTPLTSLTTNLELLDEGLGTADPQAPELVRAAREQTRELTVLVNDLIDLARYGQEGAHTEDTRLDLVARRVAERAAARAAGVVVRTELEECLVYGDPDALERAVANLVDNAVKWSPPGGVVEVRVGARGTLWVTDQGPGIPEADLPYVFDRFYRSPAARSLPGSGLGLAIVRRIAETHGGTVSARAGAGGGTRLSLELPAADAVRAHVPDADGVRAHGPDAVRAQAVDEVRAPAPEAAFDVTPS